MKRLIYILTAFVLTSCITENKDVPSEEQEPFQEIQRFGSVIRVKPEKLEEYKDLHANPWPGVDSMLKVCNIRNYSIFYRDGLLFSYLEYSGKDFESDMAILAQDSVIREWWKLTDPCQEPVPSAREGVWWADMEELYHLD